MNERIANDERMMQRCLWLAEQGRLLSRPNPMVGAVIVAADGRVLGEGYHARWGEGHAEVNAFASVRKEDEPLLSESTIYVSLEPCSHHGKTPPCADLIVSRGVRRCVVGTRDPFAKVHGRGIARLREAGIEVTEGVMEDECRWLNRRFFTFHSLHRPYIILKWAQTADGFLDDNGLPMAISTLRTRRMMHHLRQQEDAIVVGHTTWTRERPRLNARLWGQKEDVCRADGLQMPQRFVMGNIAQDELPEGYTAVKDIEALMAVCRERELQSLIVEGGRRTLQSFIDAGLYDMLRIETAPLAGGKGTPAPEVPDGLSMNDQMIVDRNEITVWLR